MKRIFSWQMFLGLVLIGLSAIVYYVHYVIFHDVHHIFIYFIGDVAFVFIEVLLVAIILHQLLTFREKKAMLKKLNMVIGAFFVEVGTELLRLFSVFDNNAYKIKDKLLVSNKWSEKDFLRIHKDIKGHKCDIEMSNGNLAELKVLLSGKRDFLLGLLENPNLLEHESFTDLLWAVFHLTDELSHRTDLSQLVDPDSEHIAGDIKRAYDRLTSEWLDYIKHLKHDYPYLFSLAVRTNPFDASAKVEVAG